MYAAATRLALLLAEELQALQAQLPMVNHLFLWVLLENRCGFFNDFQNPLLVNVHRLPLLHFDSVDQYAHFPSCQNRGNWSGGGHRTLFADPP